MNRRSFLTNSAMAAAAVGLKLSSGSVLAASTNAAMISREQYNKWFVFDGLGVLYDINDPAGSIQDDWRMSDRLRSDLLKSGLDCYRQTTGAPFPAYPGDDIFESSVSMLSQHQKLIDANSDVLMLVRTFNDIEQAKKDNKIAVTLGFQNSHVLGDNLDNVDTFKNLGVLTMQLTYNGQNQIGGGANVSQRLPLTEFGHKVVEKMNETNVLIDLSHSGERTCLEAIAASKTPLTISHSGCRALVDLPRNKTDKEMRLLADKGGLFGLYFMPFLASDSKANSDHLVAHIEHAINVCGEDHVSIGTDGGYTGIDDMEKVRKDTDKMTQHRIDNGAAAAGEKLGNLNFMPDIVGPDQFYLLANKLAERRHSSTRIEKVLGLNAYNLMKDVWK
ncbi:dipeptidase [Kangiella sediminilitoris]|uniref:Peptidase M19 renal dipeptidase n=1 Tax=Kangiella sediminilitoris TaxID=1144748 RepID=A0A1B3B9X5_9GAMM|nr:membrane dipeptidase [Kangiella sediminilitoris]AOE49593.1 Peptidase M19 renal dipeptidase [Kangiella sediminilitoris]